LLRKQENKTSKIDWKNSLEIILFIFYRVNIIQANLALQVVADFKNSLSDPDVKVGLLFAYIILNKNKNNLLLHSTAKFFFLG